MISYVTQLSRLFAAKGNEIQQAMEDRVAAGIVEPLAVHGFAKPLKFIGYKNLTNQSVYTLDQSVPIPTLAEGEYYEVLIFSSANKIARISSLDNTLIVDGSKILTTESPYGAYAIVDVVDFTYSGQTLTYRMTN